MRKAVSIRHTSALAAVAAVCAALSAQALPGALRGSHGLLPQMGVVGGESQNNGIVQVVQRRGIVAPGAYSTAVTAMNNTPTTTASWQEVTTKPYNADDPGYRAQPASNSGGGASYVTGRITGIAADSAGWVYAGGANGGVFRRNPSTGTWTPISDAIPSLSTGFLTLADDGSLWLATGEFNFGGFDVGVGVFRLGDPRTGTFSMANRVGGTELESTMIRKLVFDNGNVWAATSRGIFKHSATSDFTGAWTRVFAPVDDSDLGVDKYASNLTDAIAVQPGTHGRVMVADIAYWSPKAYNGFYYSTDSGTTWFRANPGGAINPKEIGPADMTYSADGSKLYVVMQSPALTTSGNGDSELAGVYVSNSGAVAGPYTQIATSEKLAEASSAMKQTIIGKGYQPGVQASYNRFLAVDPNDPNHVFLGLEEVYETRDGGTSWNTIGRYWNFGLGCWSLDDSKNTCNGNVMHSDQHSATIANGTIYVGNDGGLYSRSLTATNNKWTDMSSESGLRALQYYSVGVGKLSSAQGGGVAVWGGLQDNGVSLLKTNSATMVSPEGGDGGDTLVNPNNGCQALGEYVYLDISITNNCGYSPNGTVSDAVVDIAPADPNAQFTAPFRVDGKDSGYWVAAGQYVWENTKTWSSTSSSDWKKLYDVGDFAHGVYRNVTALASQKNAAGDHVIWAGWCGVCSARAFDGGIATNYGGTWHQIGVSGLPNRTVNALTIDPSDPSGKTVYAVYNGFSQRWAEGPGAGLGHVWKTTNGGASWTNVSGNLPDIPADDMVITADGTRVLATDLAVFVSKTDGQWSRLGRDPVRSRGSDIPMAVIMDLSIGPDGYVYAATYGRGIWRVATP